MKHFIGGFGLGMFIGFGFLEEGNGKAMGCFLLAISLGIAVWGLLP